MKLLGTVFTFCSPILMHNGQQVGRLPHVSACTGATEGDRCRNGVLRRNRIPSETHEASEQELVAGADRRFAEKPLRSPVSAIVRALTGRGTPSRAASRLQRALTRHLYCLVGILAS